MFSILSLEKFSTSMHQSSPNGSKDGLARGLMPKNVIDERDKVLRKARKTNNVDDWSAYKTLRDNCNNAQRKAKANYQKNRIQKKRDKTQNILESSEGCVPDETRE